jgi:hypothetical protein
MIDLNEDQIAHIFTVWDARYRKNPEEYMNVVDYLLHNTPYSYGNACAKYFVELIRELYDEKTD